jgi:hypothetical protein
MKSLRLSILPIGVTSLQGKSSVPHGNILAETALAWGILFELFTIVKSSGCSRCLRLPQLLEV